MSTDFPAAMSFEQAIKGFRDLGVYPEIENWRDQLRQWCSSVLLKPLLNKIETSHIQVMQKTSKLGINVTISAVGSVLPPNGTFTTILPLDGTQGWQPSYTWDEHGLLKELRDSLIYTIVASGRQQYQTVRQQRTADQQNAVHQQQAARISHIQECINAISEYLMLQSLMKGEWVNSLLPCSSFQVDYTVQRIRELAEGTCVKAYEYNRTEDTREKNKKWSMEPPTDSHLLLYLFCAFLEHPNWMLHLDPSSFSGIHARENPLYLGVLPPNEIFPEKYIAVVSGVPSTLHPGACVLAVDKQRPTRFALYWDKKLQFTLQGITAAWDSMLLMCHIIKVSYGGVVRGVNLGSSSLNILQLRDQ
ncbi:hypothetical protein Bca52824_034160 [Brassica carinata]|uniref:Uncharacterized protein n=1 Tax=Brassica carinata TaxID=52824 RepID=A0A8X7SE66_BRACI|nr:hypothetical protein Bca52824_034160 [Brassica carinata]